MENAPDEYPDAMAPQLYLITPANADPATFSVPLMAVLNAGEFSAILVSRGALDDAAYRTLAAKVVNIGQGAGCAVLVEDDIALARAIGADGVHVTGGEAALADAVAALKPALIVGAGNIHSRHDAMTAGEMNIDYVLFGELRGTTAEADADLAQWWSETFEVPGVLSLPGATPDATDARGAEFVALSDSVWNAAIPAKIAADIVAGLEVSA